MVGTPVIIKHQDVTKENADKLRIGTISRAYFNEPDGWFYCEGIIWDDKAQDLIENKSWSVSCSYDFLGYNDEGGEENNIHYDKEFTQLNFTHLAIVDNPRYERANIVFNSKDDEKGKWVTINGNHIFIPDGKTLDEVIKEKGWGDKENKQSDKDRIKIADLKSRENEVLKQFYEAKEGSSEREHLQYELDALKDERFRLEDKQSDKEKSEPEWLQREKQKLDRQTTQMYEDRYSTEHPETYKKNLEKAKDKQSDKKEIDYNQFDKIWEQSDSEGWSKKKTQDILLNEINDVYYKTKDKDLKDAIDRIDEECGKHESNYKKNIEYIGYELSNLKYMQDKKRNKTNNSKEQDMALLEELKKLICKVENEKENEMDSKSKILSILNEKEVDKETIEEIKNELEKIEEEKEEVKNKKEVKNEEVEEKEEKEEKVDNEEEKDEKEIKEVKEDVKKDVDNKCKNEKPDTTSFDKINAIYNSVKQLKETKTYVSRQEKLDNAVEYFK